ncbi:cupin domain-containing protein [Dysgonomonas sp. Marseille-P4677]|uniref:cupin domain-containing protein n=1 Tax=Dysgonomonas sp. Marseille-P4677 TaxID=2364790 RepID=UPI0019140EFB|nr:cupin domain-containing protein [Dysgonomonas sp. Marseille-P4677]MBK5721818.1 cupin domain-containing protein [Dysgonomonas sp. Marseille-P4677]
MKRFAVLLIIVTMSFCSVIAQNKEVVKEDHIFLEAVLSGKIHFIDKQIEIDSLVWNTHPTFKGVYLKHLIIGKDTQNKLSCHIVKVEPNCMLDTHLHDGIIEIHEVIEGNGTMYLDGKEINYSKGSICVIPANTLHKVVAGKNGLYLFAKFTSALQ